MDTIYRALALFVLSFLLFASSTPSEASFPAVKKESPDAAEYAAFIKAHQANCDTWAGSLAPCVTTRYENHAFCEGASCYAMQRQDRNVMWTRIPIQVTLICPVNSTIGNGQCTCSAPYLQNNAGTSCYAVITPIQAYCSTFTGVTQQNGVRSAVPALGCAGIPSSAGFPAGSGCVQSPVGSHVTKTAPDGSTSTWGTYSYTGNSCEEGGTSTGSTAPPVTPLTPCNGYPGDINGVSVCVPFSANAPSSVSSSSSASTTTVAGTTSSTTSTSGSPAGVGTGTSSADSKTSCVGQQCTTTSSVRSTAPDGSTSTTAQINSESKDDYCTKNPRSALCVTSSFSGACDGSFKGDGDALAVATAEAVNKTKCLLDSGSGLDGVKSSLTSGTFGSDLETKSKSLSNFNQTNPFGNSISDQQISLAGTSFTIPLSSMQTFLVALGNLAVIFTLLYSTIFVIRGL